MTAGSTQGRGAGFFTHPNRSTSAGTRRCGPTSPAGVPIADVAQQFGYTRSAMASLVRDHRAGRLELFAPPGRPGPKSAPAKDRARARVIELRREGLSVYEISARLRTEGTPLNRTGVGQILAEEGFARLIRGRQPEASIHPATTGRDTRLPTTKVIDFEELPERAETAMAGLLLAIPDLLALDLPTLTAAAGYPGTRVVPATSWILALLALKLTGTRRVSHVDDLLHDPAAALFAGLSVLPKKSALTDYSYRLSHDHQRRFLTALDTKMIGAGLAGSDEAIFDLDFHAVMHWGTDPALGEALRAHPLPTLPLRADVLRPRQRHPQPGLRQRRPVQGHPEPRSDRVRRPLEGRLRPRPAHAGDGPEGHHPRRARRTRRPRDQVPHPADALTRPGQAHRRAHPGRLQDDHPGPHRPAHQAEGPRVRRREADQVPRHRPAVRRHRPGPRRPHRDHHQRPATPPTKHLIERYARRMTIEQRLAEIIRAFHADALSSTVNLNVDLDIVLCVLAQALLAALRQRLPGYANVTPDTLQRRFLDTPGEIINDGDTITVRINRRAYSPVLRQADLPTDTTVPWWDNRTSALPVRLKLGSILLSGNPR